MLSPLGRRGASYAERPCHLGETWALAPLRAREGSEMVHLQAGRNNGCGTSGWGTGLAGLCHPRLSTRAGIGSILVSLLRHRWEEGFVHVVLL